MAEDRDFYTEQEFAARRGFTVSTCQKRRCLGKDHPPFYKEGREIRYPKKTTDEWFRKRPLTYEASDEKKAG